MAHLTITGEDRALLDSIVRECEPSKVLNRPDDVLAEQWDRYLEGERFEVRNIAIFGLVMRAGVDGIHDSFPEHKAHLECELLYETEGKVLPLMGNPGMEWFDHPSEDDGDDSVEAFFEYPQRGHSRLSRAMKLWHRCMVRDSPPPERREGEDDSSYAVRWATEGHAPMRRLYDIAFERASGQLPALDVTV